MVILRSEWRHKVEECDCDIRNLDNIPVGEMAEGKFEPQAVHSVLSSASTRHPPNTKKIATRSG